MENTEIKNYWNDLDSRLESLIKYGVVKLPSIKIFNLNFTMTINIKIIFQNTQRETR